MMMRIIIYFVNANEVSYLNVPSCDPLHYFSYLNIFANRLIQIYLLEIINSYICYSYLLHHLMRTSYQFAVNCSNACYHSCYQSYLGATCTDFWVWNTLNSLKYLSFYLYHTSINLETVSYLHCYYQT